MSGHDRGKGSLGRDLKDVHELKVGRCGRGRSFGHRKHRCESPVWGRTTVLPRDRGTTGGAGAQEGSGQAERGGWGVAAGLGESLSSPQRAGKALGALGKGTDDGL